MNNLLRISLILLFIFSIAALAMGWRLFQQREILTGRLQLAEETLVELAGNIESEAPETLTDRNLPRMAIDRDALQTFQTVDQYGNVVTSGPGTMDHLLRELRGRAAAQYAHLDDTRSALQQKTAELTEIRDAFEETEKKMAQALEAEKAAREEAEKKIAAAGELEQRTTELDREKQRMETRIEEQQLRITELNDQVSVLRMEQDQAVKEITELRERNQELQQRAAEVPDMTDIEVVARRDVPPGRKGRVLLVNHDWNFVILDIAETKHALQPMLVLFVQRDDQLVGKVRVSEIKGADRSLAVADIMPDWLQMPIREGDDVFF